MPKYLVACNTTEEAESVPDLYEIEAENPMQAVILAAYYFEKSCESNEPTELVSFDENKNKIVVCKPDHHFAAYLYKEPKAVKIELPVEALKEAEKCNEEKMYKDFLKIENDESEEI